MKTWGIWGLLSRFAGPPFADCCRPFADRDCRPFGPPIPAIHSPPFLHLPFQPPTPALINQIACEANARSC
ncbi:hypothetical protein L873DRAFT_1808141 [Choiromyces venosus 120613-1]|uniref:Uncharacterized protein n=1 Tax=Choiromyces venosus 120613-1 TaxID=1336337 RepID=A0A3N4JP04_9PEZI|nr:hypothetical protein L873DRAFT_1808141 [Choiromyces venosus 120613-1]